MSRPVDPAVIDALLEAIGLKDLDRSGWVRRGVPGAESVAAHSWGVSWLVLALCPDDLDTERALIYAVLHDLPEVRVGDLTPHDGVSREDKAAREAAALDGLVSSLPVRLRDAWHAYEAQADPESRFVRQLDRLDMAIQAVAYQQQGRLADASEFLDSAARVVDHPVLQDLLTKLIARASPGA